jgi:hypothetical protein
MIPPDVRKLLKQLETQDWLHYAEMRLPSNVDDQLALIVSLFWDAEAPLREALRDALTQVHQNWLGTFAMRMASLAIREQSIDRLRLGIGAIALAGDAQNSDWRDTGVALLPLRDAAERLNAGDGEFTAAVSRATTTTAKLISDSRPRASWHRRVENAATNLLGFYEAKMAADGFRYVPRRDVTAEESAKMLDAVERMRRSQRSNTPD